LTSTAQGTSNSNSNGRSSADTNRRRYANTAASGAGIAGAAQKEHIVLRFEEATAKLQTAKKTISDGKSKLAKLRWRWILSACRSGAYFAVLMLRGKWNEIKAYNNNKCSTLLTRASQFLLSALRMNKCKEVIDSVEQQFQNYSPTQLLNTLEIEYEEDDVEVEQLQGFAADLRPSLVFKHADTDDLVDYYTNPMKWKKYLLAKCIATRPELLPVQSKLMVAQEQLNSLLHNASPDLQLMPWLQPLIKDLQFQGLRRYSTGNGISKQAWYYCKVVEIGSELPNKAMVLFADGVKLLLNKRDIRLKQVKATKKEVPVPALNLWQNSVKLFDLTEISVLAEKINMAKDCVILLRKERTSVQTFFQNYNSEIWLKQFKLYDETNKRAQRLRHEIYKQVLKMTYKVIDAEKIRSLFGTNICINKTAIVHFIMDQVAPKLTISYELLNEAIRSALTEENYGYYDVFELFKLGGIQIGTTKEVGSNHPVEKRRKTGISGYVRPGESSSHGLHDEEEQRIRKAPKSTGMVKLKETIEVEEGAVARASATEKTVSRYTRLLARAIDVGAEKVNVELQGFQAIEQLIDENETRSPNCAICLEDIRDPVCTECVHLFCEDCLHQHSMAMPLIRPGSHSQSSFPCPLCRRNLKIHEVIKIVKRKKEIQEETTEETETSAKVPRLCMPLDVGNDDTGNVEAKWFPAIKSEEIESLITRAMSCIRSGMSFPYYLYRLEAMDRRLLQLLAHMLGDLRFGSSDRSNHRSTKIMHVVRDIKEITTTKSRKIVLFSQFKGAIDHLSLILSTEGIGHRKIVKGDSKELLSQAVEDFNVKPAVYVLLLHSSDTTAGLTLTRASYVFFLEPFLEKSAKAQAVNRAHRIGQDSQVEVRNYFVVGTVEERILAYMQWDQQARTDVESLAQLPNPNIQTVRSQFVRYVAGLES